MNLAAHYRLAPGVTVRAEHFGGLVYNDRNRQLYVLYSHDLIRLVSSLDGEHSLAQAIERLPDRGSRSPAALDALVKPLAALEQLGLLMLAAPPLPQPRC